MKKILIVEDQEDIREVIRITLETEPFELHDAADGAAGLRMALQIKPDLVLSDVMMPVMDGLTMCRSIKAEASLKRTKVILLSARGQPADRQAGTAAGADLYMAKPYGPLDLLAAVKRMVG